MAPNVDKKREKRGDGEGKGEGKKNKKKERGEGSVDLEPAVPCYTQRRRAAWLRDFLALLTQHLQMHTQLFWKREASNHLSNIFFSSLAGLSFLYLTCALFVAHGVLTEGADAAAGVEGIVASAIADIAESTSPSPSPSSSGVGGRLLREA